MKKNILLILILATMLIGCKTAERESRQETGEWYESYSFFSSRPILKIQIVKVRDCEYVLWHKSEGSDMEHYEGCQNPNHHN